MTEATRFLPGLSPVAGKQLTASCDAGSMSSDGGLVVLGEIDTALGISDVIARPLPDDRDPTRIMHTYAEMVRARMMKIAAGYEDCDDIDALRADPALKLACGRAPESGHDLMSQPTLSRLENLADRRTLMEIGLGLIDLFCRSWTRVPDRIVLDIDDTDDPAHGQQMLAVFNAHVGATCFQPMLMFEATSGKPIMALLRPGKRPSAKEITYVLRRVIGRIRMHWPKVKIVVRGDSHYCGGRVLDVLEELSCDYILGLAINNRLAGMAQPWRESCENKLKPSRPKVRRFHQFNYAADAWSKPRKVIARVEATKMGTDARFIVTNLPGRGKHLYEKVYCARGRMENLIKDWKLYTRADKTACTRWQANQFRLFLHIGAYWLLHTLRRAAPPRSVWHGATFETIRRAFIKVAVRVEELKSRIKLSFPASYPHADALTGITASILTVPP
jgi:Transposase DDE domain group 1